MKTNDFLLELGTEELPPKLLAQLSKALSANLASELSVLNLSYAQVESFATPRRLAVLVHDLQLQQDGQTIERKGPSVNASNQALEGFAKSCGVPTTALVKKAVGTVDYYFFTQQQKALKTLDLLEDAVTTAIKKIPISRRMHWGDLDFNFVRPVHWLVMMLGTTVVNASVMGLSSGNTTRGLRFDAKPEFEINNAGDYRQRVFEQSQIEVNFNARKEIIRQQITQVAIACKAQAVIDESLLDEVCALVEYPQAFSGTFATGFLAMPEEVLISTMKTHQKYFHMVDDKGELLPAFIAVANIKSSDLSVIIDGNERVIRPRLSDSAFFWEYDKSVSLKSCLTKLDSVLFMEGLGSVRQKTQRIKHLAGYIAKQIGADVKDSQQAGWLCKSDLVTAMVGEFADLQGVVGGYYALNDGENAAVATAISEHYHPRFAGDTLPCTPEGLAVAIADKIDSIVGIYGIGHKPTGSKDPYALKRAGLGLLRMMIEKKLDLNLRDLIINAAELYQFDTQVFIQIYPFIINRLEAYYQEQGIDKNILKAVLNASYDKINQPIGGVYDWHLRIKALDKFMQDDNAKTLIEANKRIKNMLKGATLEGNYSQKLTTKFDKNLFEAINKATKVLHSQQMNYPLILQEFLHLGPAIDDFFQNVMVNDDDLALRNQRLNLINQIRQLFLSVADIAYLSKGHP